MFLAAEAEALSLQLTLTPSCYKSCLLKAYDVPWYVVPVLLMTSTMLMRPVTVRSKSFALLVVARALSSVPVVRAGSGASAAKALRTDAAVPVTYV